MGRGEIPRYVARSLRAAALWAATAAVGCSAPAGRAKAPLAMGPRGGIEVQGHRGARARYPENTIPAFRYALASGVDTLELDVVVTRDDHLVVMHDLFVNREHCLAPGGGVVEGQIYARQLSLDEIRRYDCGALPNPRFPAQTPVPGTLVPTLGEVFAMVLATPSAGRVRFNIETKLVPAHPEFAPSPAAFAAMLLREIDRYHVRDRVTVESFDHRSLVALKRLAPEVAISALIAEDHPDLVALAVSLGAEVVSPELEWVTADDVRALHERGVRVVPWTANTPAEWGYLVGIGVDGIISDDPAALLEYLRGRRLR